MAKGIKTGGRQKGTPNKNRVALNANVREYLQKNGLDPDFNPVAYMMSIAADTSLEPDTRFIAAKEAAPYFYSKKKAVEHSGELESRITGEHLDAVYAAISQSE